MKAIYLCSVFIGLAVKSVTNVVKASVPEKPAVEALISNALK